MVQGAASVAAGSAAIGGAAEGIKTAEARHEVDGVSASQQRISAIAAALSRAMQEDTEDIKKAITEIEASVQAISDLIASAAQSMSDITANFGGHATV